MHTERSAFDAQKWPSRIIIIRHAEKTGIDSDPELSEEGTRRAHQLAIVLPEAFGPIDVIVAARSSEHSVRPVRTVEPLSHAIGGANQDWPTSEYGALAVAVASGKWPERQVLVCWRHKTLQQLAQALGCEQAQPWPETEYDRIWSIEPRQDGPRLFEQNQYWDGGQLKLGKLRDAV